MSSNYFQDISDACDALTEKADNYLKNLPFLTNDEICQRIWDKANQIFKDNNEDWDKVPEWVADTIDGSLHFHLGFSSASWDAHLRNLLEKIEGREEKELDFGFCVPKGISEEYCIKNDLKWKNQ